jgi:hypothetical protein
VLGVLAAAFALATAVVGFRGERVAGERDDLAASETALERRIDELEVENEQLAADLGAAQDQLSDQGAQGGPTTTAGDDPARSESRNSVSLASVQQVAGVALSPGAVEIDGTEYAQGLSATTRYPHLPVIFEYNLGRDYERLSGLAGLADDTPSGSSAVLEIIVDGELGLSQPLELARVDPIEVDLGNALHLTIRISGSEARVALVDMKLDRSSG